VHIRALALAVAPLWVAAPVFAQEECSLVTLATGTVHACTSGAGPVTVVLAAGAGQASRTWTSIRPSLTTSARVVTFDRPGLGQSLPGELPRTPTRIARELRTVVDSLGISGPLILVGHSMGGVHALRYATLFPEGVIGVVILDTPPPGFEERRLMLLSPEEREERQRLLRSGLVDAPETVRLEREGAQPSSEWDFSAFPHTLPLVVVVADSQDFGTLGSQTAHRQVWMDGSRSWLNLSSAARIVIAEGSGHMVHRDRPDIVLRAVAALTAPSGDE
jgi:pimeloyl-ACP methyl ester carboxylesterase